MIKDTIQVSKNMIYDFEEHTEIPDLEEFKERMAMQLIRSSFFQEEQKENIDMIRLPIIMAPSLLHRQVNSDSDKKTLFDKKVKYEAKTFTALAKLIEQNTIDITNLERLSADELKNVCKEINIGVAKKSTVRLLEEVKSVCGAYIAGQGK